MTFDLAHLRDRLDLETTGEGVFTGKNLALDYSRVFGGQILAQTIMALQKIAEGKELKSFTQHFPREGDVTLPMEYRTTVHQAGRTFATAGVRAVQGERLVSLASASLHRPEPGIERSDPAPEAGSPRDAVPLDLPMVPWEIRVVGDTDLTRRDVRPARYRFWTRVPEPLPDDPWLHRALLAHATDLTVIGTALLPVEGLSQEDAGIAFHSAVTSHTMWFHQGFRLDGWLLVDQAAPVMSAGRAFGGGHVWTADGRLVASFAQESMVRPVAPVTG
ncbi:acyl-CoA thioesterase [Actinocorallia sp. A-T 12471]|uniref:acyl-CoA thioesterase n=1 Tax=Actinocorallia sp. A-T 12471 TaxID=3089813 RepID=UPI0029CBD259|nr:acyl-CoA thioesterase domain-containing protein [Actinocorallia sp. A-T 12471]MDX6741504.1 thioesterase family protein [Actinocorallia sp. A-T 12471]